MKSIIILKINTNVLSSLETDSGDNVINNMNCEKIQQHENIISPPKLIG